MGNDTDNQHDTDDSRGSRRALIKAAAWSIPVVVLATATPAAAGS